MGKQNTNTVLMIEPVAFGFNAETAVNNYFQQQDNEPVALIQQYALEEFKSMVKLLQTNGIVVIVIKDTPNPHTPDSIFPNNWISFHENGSIIIYPVFAANRRLERRIDIIQTVINSGFDYKKSINLTGYEHKNYFLEGTGSMVIDRENRIIYAAMSERTSYDIFLIYCADYGYKPVIFNAFHTIGSIRLPVYHTNVILSIADKYAIICLECIDDKDERENIIHTIHQSGKVLIEISEKQVLNFAGNMLQLENKEGRKLLAMSASAFQSLDNNQISKLKNYNELIVIPVPTIEKYGGGSVRCMMAEVFK